MMHEILLSIKSSPNPYDSDWITNTVNHSNPVSTLGPFGKAYNYTITRIHRWHKPGKYLSIPIRRHYGSRRSEKIDRHQELFMAVILTVYVVIMASVDRVLAVLKTRPQRKHNLETYWQQNMTLLSLIADKHPTKIQNRA